MALRLTYPRTVLMHAQKCFEKEVTVSPLPAEDEAKGSSLRHGNKEKLNSREQRVLLFRFRQRFLVLRIISLILRTVPPGAHRTR